MPNPFASLIDDGIEFMIGDVFPWSYRFQSPSRRDNFVARGGFEDYSGVGEVAVSVSVPAAEGAFRLAVLL